MYYFRFVLFIFMGYLSGSILFGYLIPKYFFNVNTIENSEDHNPGVANAFKMGGIGCGICTIILELLKGFIPVYLARRNVDYKDLLFSLVLVVPVVGHAYPFFTHFKKGGKCIAISFGCLLGLFPNITSALILAFLYIFFSIFLIIHPHSLRSAITFLCWMCSFIFLQQCPSILIGSLLIGILVIFRHMKSVKKESEEREMHFAFKKN